ncbi:MAG: thioesterase family protein [bacterium]|jgi:acyl-CoA thioester hydrolase
MSEPRKVTIPYRVPYADTDQMHVVYYANYLAYFERNRNELIRETGVTYKELETMGYALPVVEAHVNYHAPATYDDLLDLTAWVEELKGVRLTIRCEVKRGGKLLVSGHTIHAIVDIKTLRPVRHTEELRRMLLGCE